TFLGEIGRRIPAEFDDDRRQSFTIRFKPAARGQYALYFEDESQMWDRRYFELRLLQDPAPTIDLEEPASSKQSLQMLPTADFTLRGLAKDELYSVRNVWLEYRSKKDEPAQRVNLTNIEELAAADRSAMNRQRKQIKFERSFNVADFKRQKNE